MKVFVVTEGVYSDFGINSMWSTREKAQAYIDKRMPFQGYSGINEDIEEWELDSVDVDKQVVFTTVRMKKDGSLYDPDGYGKPVQQEDKMLGTDLYWDSEGFGWYARPFIKVGNSGGIMREYAYDQDPDHCAIVWTVKTADKERAVKVVAEVVTQIVTAGIWADEEKTKEAFKK